MSKKNKIAIITGASKGIGKAISDLFQEKGITSIGLSRYIKPSKYTYQCDVTNANSIQNTIKKITNHFGTIDILVNNVGIVNHRPIEKETLFDWNQIMATNVTSHFLFCKYVLPIMKKHQYGKIINISSVAGRLRSPKASSAYVCSKYAVIGLTRQLAFQYAEDNITINCIAPGQIKTPMLMANLTKKALKQLENSIPVGRVGKPEEIAQVVYFLTNDSIGYMTGAVVDINGGQW